LAEAWFPKYGASGDGPLDCTKNRGASLQVKVLSVLRVLGRGVVFDECFDGSGCGEECCKLLVYSIKYVMLLCLLARASARASFPKLPPPGWASASSVAWPAGLYHVWPRDGCMQSCFAMVSCSSCYS
jgi:hypothetical protein